MKLKFNFSPVLPYYLFVIGVFLLIVSPVLFSDGMFMDGLIYSSIAHNLSQGIGTFWNPRFSATCMTDFHGHPPLAFGLQSIFYTLFGESRIIDKAYSLLTFVVVGYVLIKIWNALNLKHSWLPLLFWLSTPLVIWACSNNMLENTLSIFTSLSVLLYLKSQQDRKYFYIILSGLMLSLGFLTKGFVAFFPWSFPLLMWLLVRQQSFLRMIIDSLGVLFCSVTPLIILMILSSEAHTTITKYINSQVINSIINVSTVESRFFILQRLFLELIPTFCFFLIFIIWGVRKKFSINQLKINFKLASVFILLGLSGVFPIMITLKQSGFYMLATFPFFAIGLGILIYPLIDFLFHDYTNKSKQFFNWIGYITFLTGLILSVYFSNRIGRDTDKMEDTHKILSLIPKHSVINVYPNIWQEWDLHGYYQRYKNISLDQNIENKRDFLLIRKNEYSKDQNKDYKLVELQTNEYVLLKKK
jgi:4-amino-4-deoxy-L-arabinose transferase-like glycosyltransferase